MLFGRTCNEKLWNAYIRDANKRPLLSPPHTSVLVRCEGTLDSASGWGCPARASFTVVSQTRGSCSSMAVTMNWTGSDRLDTSCSVYTVPLGLTPKLGSLVTNPTSLPRWQSSNFTGGRKGSRIRELHVELSHTVCCHLWCIRPNKSLICFSSLNPGENLTLYSNQASNSALAAAPLGRAWREALETHQSAKDGGMSDSWSIRLNEDKRNEIPSARWQRGVCSRCPAPQKHEGLDGSQRRSRRRTCGVHRRGQHRWRPRQTGSLHSLSLWLFGKSVPPVVRLSQWPMHHKWSDFQLDATAWMQRGKNPFHLVFYISAGRLTQITTDAKLISARMCWISPASADKETKWFPEWLREQLKLWQPDFFFFFFWNPAWRILHSRRFVQMCN